MRRVVPSSDDDNNNENGGFNQLLSARRDDNAILKAVEGLARAAKTESNLSNLLLKTDVDLATQIANEKKYWTDLCGELMITDCQAEFIVTPPTLPFSSNYVSQSLSRLLLYTFDWIKSSNNVFKLLNTDVKTVLLQRNWFELFALGMSQCSKPLSLNNLLANLNLKFQGKMDERKNTLINEQLFYLQNFINECDQLKISTIEYAYLRLISLFDSDSLNLNYFTQLQNQFDINGNHTEAYLNAQKLLSCRDQVKSYRMLACRQLRDHINSTQNRVKLESGVGSKDGGESPSGGGTPKPSTEDESTPSNKPMTMMDLMDESSGSCGADSERFERLMLRMASLKRINASLVEELFFRDVIGNVQIDSIIPSIIGPSSQNDPPSDSATAVKDEDH